MNCPVCKTSLVMSDRSGVEIDYCPNCRGVWLDRGELDKIIERADNHNQPRFQDRHHEYNEDQRRDYEDHDSDRNHGHEKHSDYHNKKHKKENFLGDLFDF